MKQNDVLLILGGAIAAYFFLPEKVRDKITEAVPGGGGGASLNLNLNLPGIDIDLPGFNIPEVPDLVPKIPVAIPEIPTIIPKIPDLIPKIPAIPEIPNLIPKIPDLIPKIPAIPEIPNLIPKIPGIPEILGPFVPGYVKSTYLTEKAGYESNFWKGIEGFFRGFGWLSGGWQENNRAASWLSGLFSGSGILTDYAKNLPQRGPAAQAAPVVKAQRPAFSGGTMPGYTAIKPTPHPQMPGVSIVGILSGSPTPIGSIGLKPPPTKAEPWMFS